MGRTAKIDAYPLSQALTRRVVAYLNVFRLCLGVALLLAWKADALVGDTAIHDSNYAPGTLVTYIAAAILLVFEFRRARRNVFSLAHASLLLDLVMISLLTYLFGGLASGLAVLLVFTAVAAAVLLPLRRALFIAALATLFVIGDSVAGGMLRSGHVEHLVRAGLYGVTLFVITILTHTLAKWARDFRLIAERQMASLDRLEQVNELIIKRMRSGVLAVDRDGEIRMMNESAWFLLGNPSAADRMLQSVSPELHSALEHWRREPRTESSPVRLAGSQAEVIPHFVRLPAGREISELVFLEDSDVVARRALELSGQSLARLSTGIAHEIRNPLAAVSHAAQLLAESPDLAESDARMVDIITKHARRMNRIVENILQISRREKAQPEIIDLREWLVEVQAEFSGVHPEYRFELRVAGGEQPVTVLFDRSQLHQVVWKLMENAVQHLGDDNPLPRLTLRLDGGERAGFCLLSVEDNGLGIPEERIGNIFDPFVTTRREGSGLGLYIARQLCESNQAELTVDSVPGELTRFHIRMSLAAGHAASGGQQRQVAT